MSRNQIMTRCNNITDGRLYFSNLVRQRCNEGKFQSDFALGTCDAEMIHILILIVKDLMSNITFMRHRERTKNGIDHSWNDDWFTI